MLYLLLLLLVALEVTQFFIYDLPEYYAYWDEIATNRNLYFDMLKNHKRAQEYWINHGGTYKQVCRRLYKLNVQINENTILCQQVFELTNVLGLDKSILNNMSEYQMILKNNNLWNKLTDEQRYCILKQIHLNDLKFDYLKEVENHQQKLINLVSKGLFYSHCAYIPSFSDWFDEVFWNTCINRSV